jgi:hypothetical protein
MALSTEDAALHVRSGDSRELERTGETFVSLGIVVLKSNLQFDGLSEVTLLSLHIVLLVLNGLSLGELENVLD